MLMFSYFDMDQLNVIFFLIFCLFVFIETIKLCRGEKIFIVGSEC